MTGIIFTHELLSFLLSRGTSNCYLFLGTRVDFLITYVLIVFLFLLLKRTLLDILVGNGSQHAYLDNIIENEKIVEKNMVFSCRSYVSKGNTSVLKT